MRIMQIISGAGVNGAVLHCLELIRELVQREHDVTLVCRPDAWIAQQLQGVPVRIMESDLHRFPPDELKRIARFCGSHGTQVVHTHMSRAHFFGVLLRWYAGVPTVATAHNCKIQLHWPFNDHVIACSDAARRFHRTFNFVRRRRIETIHFFMDIDRLSQPAAGSRARLRSEWGVPADAPLAGILGNVIPRKGHLYLIRAWEQMIREHPRARLVIVGKADEDPTYSQRLREEAERRGVADRLVWAGFRRDVPEVLAALDLVVCAALDEAFGLTAAEASAAARPVVATNVGGLGETIVDGETGYLVPPANPSQLASAMAKLLSDPPLRERLGSAGQRRVSRIFSRESYLLKMESVYQRLTLAPRRLAS